MKVQNFYMKLENTRERNRKVTNKIIINEDCNAKVGRDLNLSIEYIRKYGKKKLNSNGKEMFLFGIINELLKKNTLAYQEIENRYTFVAEESNPRSIIEYIVFTENMI